MASAPFLSRTASSIIFPPAQYFLRMKNEEWRTPNLLRCQFEHCHRNRCTRQQQTKRFENSSSLSSSSCNPTWIRWVGAVRAIGIDASINPVADSGQFEAERYWVRRIVNPHVPLSHISTVLIANRSCSARTWFQCRALHLAVSTMGNNLHQVEKIWIKFAPSLHSRGNVTRNWVEEIADTWK